MLCRKGACGSTEALRFRIDRGNNNDVGWQRHTWDLFVKVAGRRDLPHRANGKLATAGNLTQINQHSGWFLSVLLRTGR